MENSGQTIPVRRGETASSSSVINSKNRRPKSGRCCLKDYEGGNLTRSGRSNASSSIQAVWLRDGVHWLCSTWCTSHMPLLWSSLAAPNLTTTAITTRSVCLHHEKCSCGNSQHSDEPRRSPKSPPKFRCPCSGRSPRERIACRERKTSSLRSIRAFHEKLVHTVKFLKG